MTDALAARNLSFSYRGDQRLILRDVSLSIPAGSRCLLLGANGAGKTTLLGIFGGRHMVAPEAAQVLGRAAFHDPSLASDITFLSGEFPFISDIKVSELLAPRPDVDQARQARLVEILEINPAWRMHTVSAGQRRRVQLLMGLRRATRVLLLDEITTDLDVIGRADLLEYLRQESEQRGVTTLYATHIFDGLEEWATHIAFLSHQRISLMARVSEIEELNALRLANTPAPLLKLVTRWLREERQQTRADQQGA
jgi:CCR4-NOT complex subunit CAF16